MIGGEAGVGGLAVEGENGFIPLEFAVDGVEFPDADAGGAGGNGEAGGEGAGAFLDGFAFGDVVADGDVVGGGGNSGVANGSIAGPRFGKLGNASCGRAGGACVSFPNGLLNGSLAGGCW